MNTCILCLGTVVADAAGNLQLVGRPFIEPVPHTHQTAETVPDRMWLWTTSPSASPLSPSRSPLS